MLLACLLLSATPSLESATGDYLKRTLPARFELVDVTAPDTLKGKLISARFVRPPRAGTNTAEVTLLQNTKTVKRWAYVRLGARKRVLAAQYDLPKGHVIKAGDLGYVMSSDKTALALHPKALVGQSIHRALKRADIITTQHVDRPALKARGTPVKVLSRAGAIEVATKGTLAQGVMPGERGRVLIEGQRRPLAGTLVDQETFVLDRGASL